MNRCAYIKATLQWDNFSNNNNSTWWWPNVAETCCTNVKNWCTKSCIKDCNIECKEQRYVTNKRRNDYEMLSTREVVWKNQESNLHVNSEHSSRAHHTLILPIVSLNYVRYDRKSDALKFADSFMILFVHQFVYICVCDTSEWIKYVKQGIGFLIHCIKYVADMVCVFIGCCLHIVGI
jgi:hypothetical protein